MASKKAEKVVKTHSFNGTSYKIGVDEPYYGWCDFPGIPLKGEYPAIRITDGLPYGNQKRAKLGLISLLHECLHAENYHTRENTVERISVEIGNLLWRLGYRRIKNGRRSGG